MGVWSVGRKAHGARAEQVGQGNYSIVQSRRVILHADGIVRRCGTEEGGCKLI